MIESGDRARRWGHTNLVRVSVPLLVKGKVRKRRASKTRSFGEKCSVDDGPSSYALHRI